MLPSSSEESPVKSIVILYLDLLASGSALILRPLLSLSRLTLRWGASGDGEATKGSGSGVRSMIHSCLSASVMV